MNTRKLKVPSSTVDLIRHLHPEIKKKIRNGLEAVLKDPLSGKSLRDELEGLMTFRAGHFRIVYRVSSNLIEIVTIGPRKNIYTETFRLLQQEGKA